MTTSRTRLKDTIEDHEPLHGASLAVLDLLPVAVFMVDENGCVKWTNVAAARLLERRDVIRLNAGNRLHGTTTDRTAEIHALVDAARADPTGRQHHLGLPRQTQRRSLHLSAICIDVPGPAALRVALLVSDPEFPDPLCKKASRSFFAPTATDAEVGRDLNAGQTPDSIARDLHVRSKPIVVL